ARDFNRVGAVAEANCLKMHATTLGAKPPFTYWTDATMRVMQTVQKLRKEGISAYFTIDAGPNVNVLYQPENEEDIEKTFKKIEIMQTIKKMNKKCISTYITIDEEPNVKVLYQPENEELLEKTLKETEGVSDVILSRVGAGISYL